MSVTGPATTLQAILTQIQTPAQARPAAAPGSLNSPAPSPASSASPAPNAAATASPSGVVTPNKAAGFNPDAPRGTYLNIVV